MFNKHGKLVYKPYGVIGIISPWNYPFSIPFSEVVTGLLAGNAVILKVASSTLNVGKELEKIFKSANFPENLFNYIEVPGELAGKAFINSGIDKLFFTGSTEVGKKLMRQASENLLPLVLELGGADAAIICEDADLERAANGVLWAGFSNAGQSCAGIQRILVNKKIYNAFLKKLTSLINNIKVGNSPDSQIGSLISLKQKAKYKEQIEESVRQGAVIAAQSSGYTLDDNSLFAPAIVLTDIKSSMPIMREEVFGPAVAVVSVENDEEAVFIANSSQYGLSGSVWSKNRNKAAKIAAEINAGAVMINDHLMSHGLPETPWGGFNNSGIGRTHGSMGFMEMVKTKVIIDDILPGVKRDIWWHPYSEKIYKKLKSFVIMISDRKISARIKNFLAGISLFFRYWKK